MKDRGFRDTRIRNQVEKQMEAGLILGSIGIGLRF